MTKQERMKQLEAQMHEIEALPFMGERPQIYSSVGYDNRRKYQAKLDKLCNEWLELEKQLESK